MHPINIPIGNFNISCFISATNRNPAHDLLIKSRSLLFADLSSKEHAARTVEPARRECTPGLSWCTVAAVVETAGVWVPV